ncbi:reprolysin-like metallopeptidase [Hyphobacterium sp.]|uniref:reprolysin-like metallopeptidase n=1 Tax=Hyphobacterium sp. TaxID=2004662 RepID=UPI003BABF3B6
MRTVWIGIWAVWMSVAPALAQDLLVQSGPVEEAAFAGIHDDAFRLAPGERLQLNLPEGGDQAVIHDRSETTSLGERLWIGHLAEAGLAYRVILTQGPSALFGYIATPDGAWTLAPAYPGGPAEWSRASHPPAEPGADVLVPAAPSLTRALDVLRLQQETAADVPIGSNGTVDIAIVYTQGMRNYYGLGLTTRAQHLVNVLDQSLIDSDAGLRVRLVGLRQVPGPWDEFTSTIETIDDLLAGASYGHAGTERDVTGNCSNGPAGCINNGDLSPLLAWRNAVGADIVVMLRRYWRAQQTFCGVAYLPGFGAEQDIDPAEDWVLGVAVSGDGPDGNNTGISCGDLTFAHEVGHNLGSTHNVENTSGFGVFQFSYGHRIDCNFRTIMAYDSTRSGVNCNRPTQNETWLPRFSNPAQSDCLGTACGVAPGQPHVRGSAADDTTTHSDNARSMRELGWRVRDYRPEGQTVRAAILPYSRTVAVNTPATAFVSIINPASTGGSATGCGLQLHGAAPNEFSFQQTDPATNQPIGNPGDLATIPAGGVQSFVVSVTRPFAEIHSDLRIEASCADRGPAPAINGVNTFRLTTSNNLLPDLVALAATTSNNGFVELPAGGGAGAFSVAAVNLSANGQLTVTPEPGPGAAPLSVLEICRTHATTGQCETPRAASVTLNVANGATPTFAVFARSAGPVPSAPASNRIFVNFRTQSVQLVGSTSVAFRTQ